jgi:hypothetical protein
MIYKDIIFIIPRVYLVIPGVLTLGLGYGIRMGAHCGMILAIARGMPT